MIRIRMTAPAPSAFRRLFCDVALSAVLAVGAAPAWAGPEILRAATPAWVLVTQDAVSPTATSSADAARITLMDVQYRADAHSQSTYMNLRSIALAPQGLSLMGNVGLVWNPASQDVTVHHVTILRDGQAIDVLANQSFETLRREQNLEQATLDGQLTAALQPAGLRVGDVLDVAYTITTQDPVLGDHVEQAVDLNLPTMVDHIRYRASWPRSGDVRLRAGGDWTRLTPRREGDRSVVEIDLRQVEPILVPQDAPVRFQAARRVELTDYRDWSDIAVALKPLYDRARAIAEASPLEAEIARIRGLSDDPAVRAAAALRLVQDQVRYVALMMGEGALTPASADETWTRRFGDCKAKTALLLALLDGLGIEAEPAAVSVRFGDGLNERLPQVGAFDHVLVRVRIGNEVYWLDGARTGDRNLASVPVPIYRWALPLSGPEARLEPLVIPPLTTPDSETVLAFDASAGLYVPARFTGTMTLRGDSAAALGGQLGLLSEAQRRQGLRSLWSMQLGEADITDVTSAYDVEQNVLTLTAMGSMTLDWDSSGLVLPGSTYRPLSTEPRPEGPYRQTPYLVSHPSFDRQISTLKLPDSGAGFRISGGEFDRTELGHHMRRVARIEGGVATIELSSVSLTNEVSSAEADAARAAEKARPFNPPRIFQSSRYVMNAADRAALAAATPTTAAGWLDRALTLSQARDAAGAVEAANHAVELDPSSSSAWANRGVYRYWNGDKTGAAADLAKAVDIDPSEPIAMNGHALLAMDEKRYDDVVVEMSRALRQDPADPFALDMRSRAYFELKQYDRAIRDADALIAAEPDEPKNRLRRYAFLKAAGRTAEALTALGAIHDADPSNVPVAMEYARMLIDSDEAGEALTVLDSMFAPQPEAENTGTPAERRMVDIRGAPVVFRAEALMALGRLDEAAAVLASLRPGYRNDPGWLNNLCWAAATHGALLKEALKDCDAALALRPGDSAILDSRALVYLQLGAPQKALDDYKASLVAAPDRAGSLYGRGLARIALGQTEAGEADKARALELDSNAARPFRAYRPAGAPPST